MCGALVGVVNFDNFIKQVVCCKETIAAKLRVQLVVGSLCIPWYLVFEREVWIGFFIYLSFSTDEKLKNALWNIYLFKKPFS